MPCHRQVRLYAVGRPVVVSAGQLHTRAARHQVGKLTKRLQVGQQHLEPFPPHALHQVPVARLSTRAQIDFPEHLALGERSKVAWHLVERGGKRPFNLFHIIRSAHRGEPFRTERPIITLDGIAGFQIARFRQEAVFQRRNRLRGGLNRHADDLILELGRGISRQREYQTDA